VDVVLVEVIDIDDVAVVIRLVAVDFIPVCKVSTGRAVGGSEEMVKGAANVLEQLLPGFDLGARSVE